MALRCLLRRIPVRSPSGPRMGPVHGASPPTVGGASRFLATQAEAECSCLKRKVRMSKELMEKNERLDRLREYVSADCDEFIKSIPKRRMEMAKTMENFRRDLDDSNRYVTYFCIFGYTCAAVVIFASSVTIYCAL